MSTQRKIIFLHLPKTGGSSLVNILHQHYGLANAQLIAGDEDPRLAGAIREGQAFIHGHFSANALDQAKDYFKASLLRQAGDRVISRFVHIAHSKEERLKKEYQNYQGFEDFLKSTYADNWQTRMLAGVWHQGRVNEETYIKAVDRLYELDWVASSAQMPIAALDLSQKLGFRSFYHPQLNKRASQAMWLDIDAKYRADIETLNRFDAQLVREAEALFLRRKSVSLMDSIILKAKQLGSRG